MVTKRNADAQTIAKTPVERMAKSRENRYARGVRQLNVWAHERDVERIRAYVARLYRASEEAANG